MDNNLFIIDDLPNNVNSVYFFCITLKKIASKANGIIILKSRLHEDTIKNLIKDHDRAGS